MIGTESVYDLIGGERKMNDFIDDFFRHIQANGAISALYPEDTEGLKHGYKQYLGYFLKGNIEITKNPDMNLVRSHNPVSISKDQADEWVHCLRLTLNDYGVRGDQCEGVLDGIKAKAYELVNSKG